MPRGVYERKPRAARLRAAVWCRVPGCDKEASRRALELCEAHYYRQRAHGSFEKPTRTKREFYLDRAGYVREHRPGHPAASKNGNVLQHRRLFYDAHGAGPFSCHWCNKSVGWGEMHVDHLDDTRANNSLDNLVPSCPPCNTTRGNHKSVAANKARGRNLTLAGETLPLSEWAARLGIDRNSLSARLATGWPVDKALTEPRGRFGPRAVR